MMSDYYAKYVLKHYKLRTCMMCDMYDHDTKYTWTCQGIYELIWKECDVYVSVYNIYDACMKGLHDCIMHMFECMVYVT